MSSIYYDRALGYSCCDTCGTGDKSGVLQLYFEKPLMAYSGSFVIPSGDNKRRAAESPSEAFLF